MSRLAVLVLLTAAFAAQAKEPDYRTYFAHPDVQITMEFGKWGHAETIPFENHLVLTKPFEKSLFEGGWEMHGNRPDNPRVQWKFLGKSGAGDLYLISIYQREQLIQELRVLYKGGTQLAYDREEIKVTLEPPESAKWKAL